MNDLRAALRFLRAFQRALSFYRPPRAHHPSAPDAVRFWLYGETVCPLMLAARVDGGHAYNSLAFGAAGRSIGLTTAQSSQVVPAADFPTAWLWRYERKRLVLLRAAILALAALHEIRMRVRYEDVKARVGVAR